MHDTRLGAGRPRNDAFNRAFPYLLLAPSLLVVLCVFVYPVFDGLSASTLNFRFGKPSGFVGFDNYLRLLGDPQFLNSLWVTVKFLALAVPLETVLGLALALFFQNEFPGIRLLRTIVIIPMVITPVVVAILFRLIYASDAGMLSAIARSWGGEPVQILGDPTNAFLGLVALDVWEWTPLVFLIILAGLQSLPQEPLEAARVDGATGRQVLFHHTLPMLRPVIAVAVVLRTIDAFGTFDQVFVLTRGGPGEATRLLSILGYETTFKYQAVGYGSAMFTALGVVCLAVSFAAIRLLRKVQ